MKEVNNNSAIVLFSGGQDSTTSLYWAKQKFEKIIALGFNYNQKHIVELEQAEKIAAKANVKFNVINIDFILKENGVSTNYDFIKVRNSIFFVLASNYAFQNSILNIVAGMCKSDYENFPDCRIDFINEINTAINLSLEVKITTHLPLINLTKAEVWKLGNDLEILDLIIKDTHTDYNGNRETLNDWGYGTLDNLASITRANGYKEAKNNGWI